MDCSKALTMDLNSDKVSVVSVSARRITVQSTLSTFSSSFIFSPKKACYSDLNSIMSYSFSATNLYISDLKSSKSWIFKYSLSSSSLPSSVSSSSSPLTSTPEPLSYDLAEPLELLRFFFLPSPYFFVWFDNMLPCVSSLFDSLFIGFGRSSTFLNLSKGFSKTTLSSTYASLNFVRVLAILASFYYPCSRSY